MTIVVEIPRYYAAVAFLAIVAAVGTVTYAVAPAERAVTTSTATPAP